jgi:two-component system response regulator
MAMVDGFHADPDVLLVDDDDTDVEIALEAFRALGLEDRVFVARDGMQALAWLDGVRSAPRLVIADLRMPRMGGLDLLRQMREDPRFAHVPVVVVSSSRYADDLRESYRLGANSFVRKRFGNDTQARYLVSLASYWLDLNESPPGETE